MNTCGIYKITNRNNQKSYIGQSINIERRIYQHKQAYSNQLISKAIKKHGWNCFDWEILEECPEEQLNEAECFWIAHYNTYSNGYNCTQGGKHAPTKNIKTLVSKSAVIKKKAGIINAKQARQITDNAISKAYSTTYDSVTTFFESNNIIEQKANNGKSLIKISISDNSIYCDMDKICNISNILPKDFVNKIMTTLYDYFIDAEYRASLNNDCKTLYVSW